jgi:transposase-like protein
MPDKTACKFCGRIGFIRRENIIKAGRSITSFYCGSCNRSWEETEEGRTPDGMKRAPNDSRERS